MKLILLRKFRKLGKRIEMSMNITKGNQWKVNIMHKLFSNLVRII